ncbi:MAG: DNRLRE domain-containing protein [Actinomycetota bacterium]
MAGLADAADSFTFRSTADSYVSQNRAGRNFGGVTALKLRDDSPTMHSYLQFDLSDVPSDQVITNATLRLYSFGERGDGCAASGPGVDVYRAASDNWTESGITYKNAPGRSGSIVASADGFGVSQYVEFDVTGAIMSGDLVSFFLEMPTCPGTTNVTDFKSDEAGAANRPQLVVETGSPPPQVQCSDGTDNDGDELIDFPGDPGCTSAQDDNETDPGPSKTVVAAGDIACDPEETYYDGSREGRCQHRRTVGLVGSADAVLVLGDLQYTNGTKAKFDISYDSSWGAVADRTFPAPGNHEYKDPLGGAAGYFDYWEEKGRPTGGRGSGYYSWDLSASWHIISLNTSDGPCTVGPSCAEESPQNDWLEQDLAAVPASSCILAFWHHPVINSGKDHGDADMSAVVPLWTDLYSAGADLILNGHEHNYQRYAQMTPEGVVSSDGIRQFIAGGGGRSLYGFNSVKDVGYEFGSRSHGVLELQLASDSYSWKYITLDGAVVDSGGPISCHG